MELHSKILNELCRVCGKKITLRPGYTTAKTCEDFAEIFKTFLDISPQEDEKVYPKRICSSCKNRAQYILRHNKDYNNASNIAVFQPHSDHDCKICSLADTRNRSDLTLEQLDKHFKDCNFIKISSKNKERIFAKIEVENEGYPQILISFKIKSDFTWDAYIDDKLVSERVAAEKLPAKLSKDNIDSFCKSAATLSVCKGNTEFLDVLADRIDFKEPFPNFDQSGRIATAESSRNTPLIKDKFTIVRAANCDIIISSDTIMCDSCKAIRKNLSKYRHRITEKAENTQQRVSGSSHTPVSSLKIEELEARCKNLQQSKRNSLSQLARASQKLEKIMKKEAVDPKCFTSSQHELFAHILNKKCPAFEEGTPQWLLFQQQAQLSAREDSRGMRWHPLIIRWCLSIYSISPAAYKHIASKQNKFLALPHVNTLKKFINFTSPFSGFNPDIIAKIIKDAKLESLDEYQKNVCLSFDEIRIKSGLVYKKSTGKIIGFTEMGELNDELKKLSEKSDEDSTSNIASYVLVLMIRGLFSKLCVPIAYFPSTGFRGEELTPIILEATRILEALGFKVRCWTSDGASPNRKLYNIVGHNDDFYYSTNLFARNRKIYFISDPPHLLKTLRNNLENSYGNAKSRTLMRNEKQISWMHIIDVYEWDLGIKRDSPGLRMIHKLREEHVRLTPQHRMSVKYAAQVISTSVAKGLEMQNRSETEETRKFIILFDKAFDCLNVTRIKSGDKPERKPYNSPDDPRFEFLQSVLQYLDDWEAEVGRIPCLSKENRARLLLSHQTAFGWRLTITSFIELTKKLLAEAGNGKFFLSEKLSQDPLEEHFSRHQRIAGCSDNPSMIQFEQQEVPLHAMSSDLISDLRGNTKGKQQDRVVLNVKDYRLPEKRK